MKSFVLKKLAPVMFVEAVEPCVAFWTGLGFDKTAEVPHGDALGFVILAKDGAELMYQSRASVKADVPALADAPSATALFVEVDDLDAVAARVAAAPPVFARRKTFYGSEEIAVRDPAGNVVTFAQMAR
ncbi:MAG: hypothetical protein HY908_13800 [Myxococcales bacterium]|nr:hypothetical protein [Myxococcales bacterium]